MSLTGSEDKVLKTWVTVYLISNIWSLGASRRELDSIGGGNILRHLDSIGGGNILRHAPKSLDSIGGGNILRQLDSIGGGNILRQLDSLGGGNSLRAASHVPRYHGSFQKRGYDPMR